MFGRKSKKAPRHDAITAFLGAGTEYHGQFNFQGVVRIDGCVVGDILSDGVLILGEEASIEGSIHVAELVTSGRIVGNVEATRRAILHNRSRLRGNLVAPVAVIEDGAILNGQVRMARPDKAIRVTSEPPRALGLSGDELPEPATEN